MFLKGRCAARKRNGMSAVPPHTYAQVCSSPPYCPVAGLPLLLTVPCPVAPPPVLPPFWFCLLHFRYISVTCPLHLLHSALLTMLA